MRNKKVRQMLIDVEIHKRNGCVPENSFFAFNGGNFGQFVELRSGWFFRGIYDGVVSLTGNQLRGKQCQS